MKPYEVLIFNRDYELKAHALVDFNEFEHAEDASVPTKNTVTVPQNFREEALAGAPDPAPKGWLICIKGNGREYQGVITDFTEGETQGVITYNSLLSLFDLDIIVSITGITATTIENYIKAQLVAAFVNNADTAQKLKGLSAATIAVTSSTTGTLAYTSNDNPYAGINMLDDLIVDAFNTYGIYTTISINFETQTVNISIGKVTDSTLTIEGDLPNVFENSFMIRVAKNEINKVIIWDDEANQQVEYYLHPDGTFDTTNADRILPVKNKVIIIHAETLGLAKVNDKYGVWIDAFKNYAERDTDLNNTELQELRTAAANLNDIIKAYKPFYPYDVTATETSSATPTDYTEDIKAMYDNGDTDDGIFTTYYTNFSFTWRGFSLNNNPRDPGVYSVNTWKSDGGFSFEEIAETPPYTHVWGDYDVTPSRALFVEMWTSHWSFYDDITGTATGGYDARCRSDIPINGATAQNAYNKYKETSAWRNEVEAAVQNIFNTTAAQKAAETFANNKYTNLIELTVADDDTMIKPYDLKMGQVVNVIHNNKSYNSILTSKKTGKGAVKLTFGKIRLELTKILKGAER